MQDAAPVEGMAGAQPGSMEDMPDGGMVLGAVGDAPDGVIPDDSGEGSGGEFPAGDDMPFEGAAADDGAPQGMEAGEPPAPDGLSPGDGEAGMDDAPGGLDGEGGGEDYDALLAAVSQGGMEPVPLPEDGGGSEADIDGEGQGNSSGEAPPTPQEDHAGELPPAPDDPDASDGPTPFGVLTAAPHPSGSGC